MSRETSPALVRPAGSCATDRMGPPTTPASSVSKGPSGAARARSCCGRTAPSMAPPRRVGGSRRGDRWPRGRQGLRYVRGAPRLGRHREARAVRHRLAVLGGLSGGRMVAGSSSCGPSAGLGSVVATTSQSDTCMNSQSKGDWDRAGTSGHGRGRRHGQGESGVAEADRAWAGRGRSSSGMSPVRAASAKSLPSPQSPYAVSHAPTGLPTGRPHASRALVADSRPGSSPRHTAPRDAPALRRGTGRVAGGGRGGRRSLRIG